MKSIDHRSVERVYCQGLPITTFLSDDRRVIWVSTTDLVDQLSVSSSPVGEEFVIYDYRGVPTLHLCIPYTEFNDYVYSVSSSDIHNLNAVRSSGLIDLVEFWNRHQHSAASMSIHDALNIIDKSLATSSAWVGLPGAIMADLPFRAIGLSGPVHKTELKPEERMFVTSVKALIVSQCVSASLMDEDPASRYEMLVRALEEPLSVLGKIVRSCDGLIAPVD